MTLLVLKRTQVLYGGHGAAELVLLPRIRLEVRPLVPAAVRVRVRVAAGAHAPRQLVPAAPALGLG